ncbi:MAG TPA: hypothetical protein VGF75_04610, partial [Candidatus Saccharimonadales bacterium]
RKMAACPIESCDCEDALSKIVNVQELLVKNKVNDIIDSTITARLFNMKEMGISYDDSIYEEARGFLERCFQDAINQYFRSQTDQTPGR